MCGVLWQFEPAWVGKAKAKVTSVVYLRIMTFWMCKLVRKAIENERQYTVLSAIPIGFSRVLYGKFYIGPHIIVTL